MPGPLTPVIVGPTGVGKTAVAVALASQWPIEVISADSRQVYRRLDVGTAKPTKKERAAVPHHGLDLVSPGERYSSGRFARDATQWLSDIATRHRQPVVVGGSGLYIRALADGLFHEPVLDPERRRELERWTATLEPIDLVRWAARLDARFQGGGRQRAMRAIEVALLSGRPLSAWQEAARGAGSITPFYVRLTAPRQVLHQRIRRRALQMVQQGMIEEVAAVLADGAGPASPGLDAIGIREVVAYLTRGGDRSQVAEQVAITTRQYAKRQETWFRHQLGSETVVLDATEAPDTVARRIAEAWSRKSRGGA